MATTAMRIKTTEAATGKTKTKTISPILFSTAGTSTADYNKATLFMSQKIVSLTTNTYGSTDRIVTTNLDTEVNELG